MKRQKFLGIFCFSFAALILAGSLVLLFGAGSLLEWYFTTRADYPEGGYTDLLIAFYIAYPLCFAAVSLLMRILWNIVHDRLFIRENTNLFRIVSYLAMAVSVLCLLFTFKYFSLFILGIGILLIGFLLQVLVQVFAAATELSDENSLTI
ncbi:MAG: DUF2975 domain-containing protein [Eubacteriales bacterium]